MIERPSGTGLNTVLLHIEETGVPLVLAHQTEPYLTLAEQQAEHGTVIVPIRLVPAVGGNVHRLSRPHLY